MSKISAKKLISIFIAAIAVFNTAWVSAQEEAEADINPEENADSSLSIQEVVVTARKGKAENLQIVPMAINAISADAISEKAISGIEDVTKMVSGLTFDAGLLPNDTRPTLRGLSTTRGRSNVATLVDYVDVSSEALSTAGGGMTGNMRLTDLERIEVIKGPQTVMYGRSAFSGAINYVTKRPNLEEFEGSVDTDLNVLENNANELNAHEVKGAFTGPITDTLGYRVNVAQSESNGWYDNPNTGGDLGTEQTLGTALAVLFEPSDTFSSYTRAEYSDEEYAPRAQVLRRTVDNTPVLGDYVGTVSNLDPGSSNNPTSYDNRNAFYNHGSFVRDGSVVNAPTAFNSNGTPKVNCSLEQVPFRNRGTSGGFAATGNNAYCRPLLVGSQDANASEIDLSADPATGKDFRGTELENMRIHQEFAWDFETVQFTSITAYTNNQTNIQEDFDLTDYSLYGGERGADGFYQTINDNSGTLPPLTNNCNGKQRRFDASIPGSGECIAQYGFQTAMDIDYDLEQISQEFRFNGETDNFKWMAGALVWQEDLGTVLNDKWWLREGGTDIVNSAFVSPGASSFVPYDSQGNPTGATGMPYLDANNDGLNDARDCLGADYGDESKGCYITARSFDQTSPYEDTLSRETDHFSIAGSLTWKITDTINWTNEIRALREQITYKGSGSLLHGLSSAFGNCGGFMIPMGYYPIDPNDIDGDGSTSEVLNDPILAGHLIPDMHGQCMSQENELDTISEYVPRTSIDWQATDDLMVYFTYAEGFKPGGIDTTNASSLVSPSDLDHETVSSGLDLNGNGDIDNVGSDLNGDGIVNGADTSLATFDPDDRIPGGVKEFQPEYKDEQLKTLEVGMKSEWLDGRVLFNSSVYYYEYTDQQLPLLVKVGSGGLIAPTVVNAGESRVEGFEFDFTTRITESLTLMTGYTYSDAYYEDFNTREIAEERFGGDSTLLLSGSSQADAGNPDGDFSGKQMPFSAKHSVTMSLRYDTSFSNGLDGFAELGAQWQDKRYMSAGNNAYLEAYDLWNLSTGISEDNWSAVLYVDNLLDDDTIRSGILNTDYGYGVSFEFDLAQAANLVLPQPRTIGVRFGYKF